VVQYKQTFPTYLGGCGVKKLSLKAIHYKKGFGHYLK